MMGEAIELDEEERELVGLELDAMIPGLRGERQVRYQALAGAVANGAVPPELQPQLESVLSITLQTARARQMYRAEGEKILTGLYRRTPAGRELRDHLGEINQALTALTGHELTEASVRMRTLGHFTVSLRTDAARITLAVRPEGVNIESVAVGEGGSSAS